MVSMMMKKEYISCGAREPCEQARELPLIQRPDDVNRQVVPCCLCWVDKLCPNLKKCRRGCKFSTEEERMGIELPAEFGNKQARIVTFLPGRTGNDVKYFWSSRPKRLTRISHAQALVNPSSSASTRLQRRKKESFRPPWYGVPSTDVRLQFSFLRSPCCTI